MSQLLSTKYRDPRRIAADVLRRSGMPRIAAGDAIDVAAILREYGGFDVAHVPDLSVGGRRLLGLFVPEYNVIMVEANSIESRKRFSMAHELGHAELEHDFGQVAGLFSTPRRPLFGCTTKDEEAGVRDDRAAGRRRRAEIRANQFAAELLMPPDLVRQVWRKSHDVERTAAALLVSRQALGFRLRELRLI